MEKKVSFELNQNLCFINVTSELANKFGSTPDSLEGERIDAFVSQECAPNFLEAILGAFRGITVKSVRLQMIQKQRKKIDVDMSFHPIEPEKLEEVKGLNGHFRFLPNHVQC